MARMTISLRCDPVTGKKDVIVKLHSDADTLPMEHEQQHRALVDKLIEGGVLKASEAGKVVVEREEDTQLPAERGAIAPEAGRKAQRQ
jgi:hypothetical protein